MELTDIERDVIIASLEDRLAMLLEEIGQTDDQDESMDRLKLEHKTADRLLRRLA